MARFSVLGACPLGQALAQCFSAGKLLTAPSSVCTCIRLWYTGIDHCLGLGPDRRHAGLSHQSAFCGHDWLAAHTPVEEDHG